MLMTRVKRLFVLFLIIPWLGGAAARPPADEGSTLVLSGGLLIDGHGADPLPASVVVIQGNKIVSVGTAATVPIPQGAKVIDVSGMTLLPGLMNMHVHRGYNPENLRAWAQAGVTTVRDLAYSDASVDWYERRDELAMDPMNARLVAAGPMVTAPAGYPVAPFALDAVTVRNVDEAARKTSNLLERGADTIKITFEDGHYYEAFYGQELPHLDPKRASAIIAVAHEHGAKVSAHITNPALLDGLLETDVDDIAHMVLGELSDDAIQLAKTKDVYWVPTLELWFYIQNHPESAKVNFKPFDEAVANLGKIVRAGGKVALGTDFDGIPGGPSFDLGLPVKELSFMEQAGMTRMQVIVAATKNAAHVANLGETLGTIEAGKTADIVVLSENPLEDLKALASAVLVLRDGVIVRDDLE